MGEERVVEVYRYDDKPYEGPNPPASPQALSEAIRARHQGNLDASLLINIGGDPEKVGYPVIPWLAVSTSRGMIAVSTQLGWDDLFDLVGDASATEAVPLAIGGQEAPFPEDFW